MPMGRYLKKVWGWCYKGTQNLVANKSCCERMRKLPKTIDGRQNVGQSLKLVCHIYSSNYPFVLFIGTVTVSISFVEPVAQRMICKLFLNSKLAGYTSTYIVRFCAILKHLNTIFWYSWYHTVVCRIIPERYPCLQPAMCWTVHISLYLTAVLRIQKNFIIRLLLQPFRTIRIRSYMAPVLQDIKKLL